MPSDRGGGASFTQNLRRLSTIAITYDDRSRAKSTLGIHHAQDGALMGSSICN